MQGVCGRGGSLYIFIVRGGCASSQLDQETEIPIVWELRWEQELQSSIVRGGRASSRRDQELAAVLKLSLDCANFKHLIKSAASTATRLFKFRAPDQVDCQRSLPGRLKFQAPDQVGREHSLPDAPPGQP